jgi:thiamine-phosphate pyrophosphorylase
MQQSKDIDSSGIKKYLITSREFYTDTPAVFRSILHERLKTHMPDFALYRDKSNPNYKTQAEHFIQTCSCFDGLKAFIHRDVDLAYALNAIGVHLTSNAFDDIQKAKELSLEVIISTHTKEEALKAEKLGADYVTYSPIFASPNKGEPKGIDDLKALLDMTSVKIFALGGIINEEQIEMVKESGAYGFASIRYFY